MKKIFFTAFLASVSLFLSAVELTKADKEEYKYTVWSQANPWFPPNLMPPQRVGGTDYAWHKYSDDPVELWKKVAEVCKPYGMTGIQMEVSIKGNGEIYHAEYLKYVLDGFARAGNGFKVMPFISTRPCPDRKSILEVWDKYFSIVWNDLKNHPAAYRLNGKPVMTLYTQQQYTPDDWRALRAFLKKKYGPCIMLMNTWMPPLRTSKKLMREYVKVFDGVTAYANFSAEVQEQHMKLVSEVMKEFPDKIFEAPVHNTYTQHYNYGGTIPKLTDKYRRSLDIALSCKPDSLVLTNFFDIYENSRILPSYEYEDVLLELIRMKKTQWMGKTFEAEEKYPYYLSNFTSRYAGQPLLFELLALPGKNKTPVSVQLEIANASGKRLVLTEPVTVPPGKFFLKTWSFPPLSFHEELELYPRLVIDGKPYAYSPPTMLNPSNRSHLLWYTRSIKNQLPVDPAETVWEFCGGKPGEIVAYPENGAGFFRFTSSRKLYGCSVRLLRNGAEFAKCTKWRADLAESIALPNPGLSCDSYALELTDSKTGARYRTPSVFVSGSRREQKHVMVPIVLPDRKIKTVPFRADRIPCFYYRGDLACGSLLVDSSGYRHDGFMGGVGYGGGHLLNTGYRHEHTGGLSGQRYANSPEVVKDGGYLKFSGKEYINVQGGTTFPYAMTIEFEILREKGASCGVLGSGRQQIQVYLRGDGRLLVQRSTGNSSAYKQIITDEIIPVGTWTKAAIVYDGHTLKVYLNGKESGSLTIAPCKRHETFNAMVIGASCKNLNQPDLFFRGGLRKIRITGRNLAPDEFLK